MNTLVSVLFTIAAYACVRAITADHKLSVAAAVIVGVLLVSRST